MRTTLSLDEDVIQLVKSYAENRSMAMGKAVSELVRRGLSAPVKTRTVNGLVSLMFQKTAIPLLRASEAVGGDDQ